MPWVVIRPKALEDLAEVWAYIADDSPRQADAFAAGIDIVRFETLPGVP